MSMMELPSGAVPKSTLNPDAPLFIPMAFQQVQDFSPEWWELVKTTTWFREHWFHIHQDQETFDADEDEDVANLLPDSIDLDIGIEQVSLQQSLQEVAMNNDMINLGFLNDAEIAANRFGSRAPKNDGMRALSEPAKYHEKPVQRMIPKFASRHLIQQPR
ncbi:protein EARLY RESPONSIVE TO DEHYDRATION 15-like [Curcuma longa]|uniref:protein EARLY RESPONSIVE TO DEHYDRATION 15-like n=1 Tax=Curcuma longa TaxID=136217 RepID=UPI003D9F98AB